MNIIGNIIWLAFGGFFSAIGYFFGGLILCLTVIGIPFGLQCFKLGLLCFWPFGSEISLKPSFEKDIPLILNVLWLILGGFWILLSHLFFGVLLYISIIGIPWGKQHFKMAHLALSPFGKTFKLA